MAKLIYYKQDRSWTEVPIIREALRNHHRNRSCLLMLFYSLQLAAIPLLEPERVQQEKVRHFLDNFLANAHLHTDRSSKALQDEEGPCPQAS